MNGGQRAVQLQRLPEFLQRDVLLLSDQIPYLLPELLGKVRLASAYMIPGGNIAGSFALGQEFLHHPQ